MDNPRYSEELNRALSAESKPAYQHTADLCRANGWGTGTRLVGDEGRGPEVILITAVGEKEVLARSISINGQERQLHEGMWDLHHRAWKVLE